MTDLPKQVANTSNADTEIPQVVAEIPQDTEAPEANPYVISFAKYNEKLCEIEGLGKNKGNKALSIFKEIGTKVYSRSDFQRHKIKTDGITCSGEYKKLYNGLGPDVEVRELFLQGTGRIFYFDIEPERKMYVVAIRENHFETDKVRR